MRLNSASFSAERGPAKMKLRCMPLLLALYACAAFAQPEPAIDPAEVKRVPPALRDAADRYALQATVTLAPAAREKRGADARFALSARLHRVQAPMPHDARHRLESRLGSAGLGSCTTGQPDPVFRDGFEH